MPSDGVRRARRGRKPRDAGPDTCAAVRHLRFPCRARRTARATARPMLLVTVTVQSRHHCRGRRRAPCRAPGPVAPFAPPSLLGGVRTFPSTLRAVGFEDLSKTMFLGFSEARNRSCSVASVVRMEKQKFRLLFRTKATLPERNFKKASADVNDPMSTNSSAKNKVAWDKWPSETHWAEISHGQMDDRPTR